MLELIKIYKVAENKNLWFLVDLPKTKSLLLINLKNSTKYGPVKLWYFINEIIIIQKKMRKNYIYIID
jgi:hypothetical protein